MSKGNCWVFGTGSCSPCASDYKSQVGGSDDTDGIDGYMEEERSKDVICVDEEGIKDNIITKRTIHRLEGERGEGHIRASRDVSKTEEEAG
jgi:hypothetical protein